jgi:hypothetical protein
MRSFIPAKFASLLSALSFTLLASATAVAQPCPGSSIYLFPPPPDPIFSTIPIRTVSFTWDLGNGSARYNLVLGTIAATSIGDPAGGFGSHVRAEDQYVLLGPAGPPVAFSVRLYVTGTAEGRNDGYLPTDMGSVTMSAALIEPGGAQDSSTVTASPGQTLPFNPTLEIPLTHAVGEPFDVLMALHTQGGFSTGILNGKLSFIMPPGYAIASCSGFAGSGATAAAKGTWGSLKLRYR